MRPVSNSFFRSFATELGLVRIFRAMSFPVLIPLTTLKMWRRLGAPPRMNLPRAMSSWSSIPAKHHRRLLLCRTSVGCIPNKAPISLDEKPAFVRTRICISASLPWTATTAKSRSSLVLISSRICLSDLSFWAIVGLLFLFCLPQTRQRNADGQWRCTEYLRNLLGFQATQRQHCDLFHLFLVARHAKRQQLYDGVKLRYYLPIDVIHCSWCFCEA